MIGAAVSGVLGKALVVVKGDTKHARDEIAKLSAAEQAAARARVKAQEESNAALERSNQKFGLYVAGAAAGWAVISSSVKKYEEHLKSLGANGVDELDRLQNVTGRLSKAQDNLQIAIGKVAMAAEPAALALADMANALARIVGGVGDLLQKVRDQLPGGGPKSVGSSLTVDGRPLNEAIYWRDNGMAQLDPRLMRAMDSSGFENPGVDLAESESRVSIHPSVAQAMGWRKITGPDGLFYWRPPTDAERAEDEAKVKLARDAWVTQQKKYADAWRDVISPAIGATSGASRGGGDVGYGRNLTDDELLGLAGGAVKGEGADLSAIGDYDFPALKALRESMERGQQQLAGKAHRESMLEKIFGPVSEFELYTTAWQGLETVVTAGLNAWIDGTASAGEAMKDALHGFAKQLAGEAVLQALRHGAYALGSLAFGRPDEAAAHGWAALKWGGVAVAAGGYAKLSAPSGAGAGGSAYAAAGIGGGPRAGGAGGSRTVNVFMGDWTGNQTGRTNEIRYREIERRARNLVPPPAGVGD